MSWQEVLDEAAAKVRAEFDDIEQALIEDVTVLWVEQWGRDYYWAVFLPKARRIEVCRKAFDTMPPGMVFHDQLYEVLRHEFWHALGERHTTPEHMVTL